METNIELMNKELTDLKRKVTILQDKYDELERVIQNHTKLRDYCPHRPQTTLI